MYVDRGESSVALGGWNHSIFEEHLFLPWRGGSHTLYTYSHFSLCWLLWKANHCTGSQLYHFTVPTGWDQDLWPLPFSGSNCSHSTQPTVQLTHFLPRTTSVSTTPIQMKAAHSTKTLLPIYEDTDVLAPTIEACKKY